MFLFYLSVLSAPPTSSQEFRQCVIYDSASADARLIGIEYIISRRLFEVGRRPDCLCFCSFKLPRADVCPTHVHTPRNQPPLHNNNKTLPDDEKRLWHSHAYEVLSGQLVAPGLPAAAAAADAAKLADTYGKTVHTWQVDRGDALPLGEGV